MLDTELRALHLYVGGILYHWARSSTPAFCFLTESASVNLVLSVGVHVTLDKNNMWRKHFSLGWSVRNTDRIKLGCSVGKWHKNDFALFVDLSPHGGWALDREGGGWGRQEERSWRLEEKQSISTAFLTAGHSPRAKNSQLLSWCSRRSTPPEFPSGFSENSRTPAYFCNLQLCCGLDQTWGPWGLQQKCWNLFLCSWECEQQQCVGYICYYMQEVELFTTVIFFFFFFLALNLFSMFYYPKQCCDEQP